jgi:hypothetical protein
MIVCRWVSFSDVSKERTAFETSAHSPNYTASHPGKPEPTRCNSIENQWVYVNMTPRLILCMFLIWLTETQPLWSRIRSIMQKYKIHPVGPIRYVINYKPELITFLKQYWSRRYFHKHPWFRMNSVTDDYKNENKAHFDIWIKNKDVWICRIWSRCYYCTGNVRINVTLRRFRLTIVAVEKQ